MFKTETCGGLNSLMFSGISDIWKQENNYTGVEYNNKEKVK